MHKYLGIGLLCLFLLALCDCGQAEPEPTTAPPTTITTTSTPTTAQDPATLPIKYPASYKDAPEAYKPVLDELHKTQLVPFSDEDDYTPDCSYAVVDINKDGIPELLTYVDCGGDYLEVLYTLKNNKPVELSWYSIRACARFAADGTIYFRGSGGAGSSCIASLKLKPGASELTQLTIAVREVWGSEDDTVYYQASGEEKQSITEEEFWELCEKYTNPPNPMPLTFIPVEQ